MISLSTKENKTSFLPGEEIEGTVSWNLQGKVDLVEIRLGWRTKGKGDVDGDEVQAVNLERPMSQERREFRLKVPEGPYSFSGKLISLVWVIEAVALPAEEAENLTITVSPTGKEVSIC